MTTDDNPDGQEEELLEALSATAEGDDAPKTTEAEGEEPATAEGETPPESEEESSDRVVLDYLKELTGEDLSGQFANDAEFLKSHVELRKAIGRKDEDAAIGKWLKQNIGGREQEFQEWLAGQGTNGRAKPAGAKDDDDEPPTLERLQFLRSQVVEKDGEVVPAPGAPRDAVDQLQRATTAYQRNVDQAARLPKTVKALQAQNERMAAELESLKTNLGQRDQQLAAHSEMRSWAAQNKDWLHDGGNLDGALTEHGRKVVAFYEDPENAGLAPVRRLELAKQLVLAGQPKAKPKAKPSAASLRRAPVAVPQLAGLDALIAKMNQKENPLDVVDAMMQGALSGEED